MDDHATTSEARASVRLYADENFPLPVVLQLRSRGYDVLTVQEAGQGERRTPDEVVLSFAHSDRRAVITHNRRDFMNLHRQSALHSGIIVCTADPNPSALASRIDEAISPFDSLDGQLIKINRVPAP
jgi:predicted nuclease of predicted toxin-antitoxin system